MVELKCFTYGPTVEFFLFLRRRPPGHGARWERDETGRFQRSTTATTVSDHVDDSPLPEFIDELLAVASRIGSHFDHMRVDFLSDGTRFYLGELTVYHNAGTVFGQGHLDDAPASRSWDLRNSWCMTVPQTGWRKHYAEALRRRIARREDTKPQVRP
jgi:hypothetical protein